MLARGGKSGGAAVNNTSIGFGTAPEIAHLGQARPLEDCACLQLRKASRAISRLFDKILESSGLKATQFSILAAIDDAESTSVSELASHLVMDASTVARNLKPLEKSGLIAVLTAHDRRRKFVRLTQKGTLALAVAIPLWQRAHDVLQDMVGAEILAANSENLRLFLECISDLSRTL